jgi:hypothetical protein
MAKAHFATAGSWSTPENISNSSGDSNMPAIAIDNSSDLRVICAEQFAPTRLEIMYASAPLPEEGGGLPIYAIVGIAVGGVAAAAGIYFFVIRRWMKQGSVN